VVCQLAQGLTAAGHEVVLYATGDSTAPVPIVYATATADWDRIDRGEVELPHVMGGYEALAGCDIIHDHTLLGRSLNEILTVDNSREVLQWCVVENRDSTELENRPLRRARRGAR
jgi:hypothetical protein